MDTLGRDDELRTIHAFLDRPAPDGIAALVLEGEAGIGSRRSGSQASKRRANAGSAFSPPGRPK